MTIWSCSVVRRTTVASVAVSPVKKASSARARDTRPISGPEVAK